MKPWSAGAVAFEVALLCVSFVFASSDGWETVPEIPNQPVVSSAKGGSGL
jgi:hypothetical protein